MTKSMNDIEDTDPSSLIHSAPIAHALSGRASELLQSPRYVQILLSCLDITLLDTERSPQALRRLVDKALNLKSHFPEAPYPAGICSWSEHTAVLSRLLEKSTIRTVVVAADFPMASAPLQERINSVQAAVKTHADEVDLVFPYTLFLHGDEVEASREIRALIESAGETPVKVILETETFQDESTLVRAANVALTSGASFLKTSTGFLPHGADLWRVNVLADQIQLYWKATNRRVGLKISGGIREVDQVGVYLALILERLGEDWLSPAYFRIGASKLADKLLRHLDATLQGPTSGRLPYFSDLDSPPY